MIAGKVYQEEREIIMSKKIKVVSIYEKLNRCDLKLGQEIAFNHFSTPYTGKVVGFFLQENTEYLQVQINLVSKIELELSEVDNLCIKTTYVGKE